MFAWPHQLRLCAAAVCGGRPCHSALETDDNLNVVDLSRQRSARRENDGWRFAQRITQTTQPQTVHVFRWFYTFYAELGRAMVARSKDNRWTIAYQ